MRCCANTNIVLLIKNILVLVVGLFVMLLIFVRFSVLLFGLVWFGLVLNLLMGGFGSGLLRLVGLVVLIFVNTANNSGFFFAPAGVFFFLFFRVFVNFLNIMSFY